MATAPHFHSTMADLLPAFYTQISAANKRTNVAAILMMMKSISMKWISLGVSRRVLFAV